MNSKDLLRQFIKDNPNAYIQGRGYTTLSITGVIELFDELALARQQRDEMARELEKLREHAFDKFSNKRNRL